MNIIEAQASRSFTLKVAKADYRGEERYRPNEDIMVHAGLKATLAPGEDAAAARAALQKMCEDDVAVGVKVAREEARRRLEDAINPQRGDPAPQAPAVTAAQNSAQAVDAAYKPRQAPPLAAPVPATALQAYQPAANLPAAQRLCTNTIAHKAAQPAYLQSNVYDFSLERFGRPLCRNCQVQASPIVRRT